MNIHQEGRTIHNISISEISNFAGATYCEMKQGCLHEPITSHRNNLHRCGLNNVYCRPAFLIIERNIIDTGMRLQNIEIYNGGTP